MAETFTINGIDLNNFAWVIQDAKTFGMAPNRRDMDIEIAARDGALAANRIRYDSGVLTIPMWIKGVDPVTGTLLTGTDIDQFYKNVDSLYRLLSAPVLTIIHTRPDATQRKAVGHLVGTLDLSREVSSPLWGQFTAQIKIPGSFWASTSNVTQTGSLTTGSSLSMTNFQPSTAPLTDLVVTFGPCNNPQITQNETGVFVAYDGVISAGRQLTIDTSTNLLGYGTGTAWAPDYSLLRHGGDSYLFSIMPNYDGSATGVTIVHTGGGSASLTIAGPNKYLTA